MPLALASLVIALTFALAFAALAGAIWLGHLTMKSLRDQQTSLHQQQDLFIRSVVELNDQLIAGSIRHSLDPEYIAPAVIQAQTRALPARPGILARSIPEPASTGKREVRIDEFYPDGMEVPTS